MTRELKAKIAVVLICVPLWALYAFATSQQAGSWWWLLGAIVTIATFIGWYFRLFLED
jgi:hypothetical protein